MKEAIKERVIDSMFDRWCGQTDYDADARAAMEKAVKQPTEDAIFQVAATTEARAYKEGIPGLPGSHKRTFSLNIG